MAYNIYLGKTLLLISVLSCLYSVALLARQTLTIWAENLWMVPIFLFGVTSVPYLFYSVRSYWEVAWKAFILPRLRPVKFLDLLEEHSYHSVVLPSDCDVFNHMNNSRYGREADFSRVRWYVDTGLINFFRHERKYLIMAAMTIRYRRSLEAFQSFTIKTKMIYWDEKNIYLQHKFITTDPKTDSEFINAIMVTQMRVLSRNGTEDFLRAFLKTSSLPEKPKLATELDHYLQYLKACSSNLRNESFLNLPTSSE